MLRGALVGASQAVWILESEDRNVLRERGRTVLTEMYAQMDKCYGFLESTPLDAARRLWREMSADAHVLGWSLFQRTIFEPAERRTGAGEGKAP